MHITCLPILSNEYSEIVLFRIKYQIIINWANIIQLIIIII